MKGNVFVIGAVIVLLGIMLGISSCSSNKPKGIKRPPVISRVAWSGLQESGSFKSQTPTGITIFPLPYKLETGEMTFAKFLVRLQNDHINKKKWGDIGYHYFVAPTGETYAGRQVIFRGMTDEWKETDGQVLVAVLGDYEKNDVSPELANTLSDIVAWLIHDLKIPIENVDTLSDHVKGSQPAKFLDSFVHVKLIPEVKERLLYKEHPEKFGKERKPRKEERQRMETLNKYGE